TLAAENQANLPYLATALNNLGGHYSEVGRRQEAVAPVEEAVQMRRVLAAENPAYLPDLATALNNLGGHYSEVGRRQEAVAPAEEAVQRYRTLAAENPAYLPDLASALNNLSNRYSEVDRRQEAVAPAEEAVQQYRTLAAENPAHLPDLATALNNLGGHYSEVGRRQEAVAPVEEAVQMRRVLAAENPAYLPDLVNSLSYLLGYLKQVGRHDDGELTWQQTLVALADQAATLLYLRAVHAPTTDARALEWLATALKSPGMEPGLERAIHEAARELRANDPIVFDAQWSAASGEPTPDWLSIPVDLLEKAVSWVNTPTFEHEAAWLAEHPELLDPASDVVVTEALLGIENDEANRLRKLRAAAQSDGVSAAYNPLLDAVLLRRFLNAELPRQIELLDAEGERLRQPAFVQSLSSYSTQDDPSLVHAAMQARALILLSTTGRHRVAIDALADQAEFDNLQRSAAIEGRPEELSALATLLMTQASNSNQNARALFYQAIAGLLNGAPPDQIRDLVHALRQVTEAPEYINLTASIGTKQPKALAIVPLLTEPLPPETEDGQE
ncbi:MAG TPA: tetratricopeptide repeat protein, partial [Kineosporiaceae bacterium]|nr:tetratricopeptide repeat protein [Kineosporiaceae bacterium]